MSFQALFGDAYSLLVQLGLLGHVPYLRDYHRPEYERGDHRGDRLLTEDAYACVHLSPAFDGLYLYV